MQTSSIFQTMQRRPLVLSANMRKLQHQLPRSVQISKTSNSQSYCVPPVWNSILLYPPKLDKAPCTILDHDYVTSNDNHYCIALSRTKYIKSNLLTHNKVILYFLCLSMVTWLVLKSYLYLYLDSRVGGSWMLSMTDMRGL